ncbi:hypothetical protein [Serratia sp. UGAL515B_01]|uniref:hypothetical protein n=1 Tax=Serratia sp. UGAL515B_01 TaxID=2986763 RepID=UPI002952F93E|nr:hypothetical protein [Serratia sp. UGAL515B_01]WON77805.1 hypothetical protein OK023_03715 [Serratia sp. UGAL515B_01]
MSEENTLEQVSAKACQLDSILSTVLQGRLFDISSVDAENLIDLAASLAGEVGVFLLELASKQDKASLEIGKSAIDIENELRRAEHLLSASAELHGGSDDEREISFELLDKVLFRLREIKEAYSNGGIHA